MSNKTASLVIMDSIPVEIWDIIMLKYVRPGEHLYNMYNAYSSWKDILEPNKVQWMFVQVLPSLFGHLSKTDMLTCRLVSKQWCKGVDYVFEHTPAVHRTYSEYENELCFNLDFRHNTDRNEKRKVSYLKYYSQLEKLLEVSSDYSGNPIIGRSVNIWYATNSENFYQTEKIFFKVLDKFGHHIHFLKIMFFDELSTDLLVSFVELFSKFDLSNLKHIFINKYHSSKMYLTLEEEPQDEPDVELQLQKYIDSLTAEEKNRFPKNLESIKFGNMDMCGRIKHEKIKRVIVNLFSTKLKSLSNLYDYFVFPLNIEFSNICDLSINVKWNENVDSLYALVAPIRRLRLMIEIGDFIEKTNTARIIESINRFRDTLRYVELDFHVEHNCPEETIKPFTIKDVLDLPNIVTLVVLGLPPSFNFITGLKSVQYLHLKWTDRNNSFGHYRVKEELDFIEYWRWYPVRKDSLKFYESKLWTVFKRLRTFTINYLIYERYDLAVEFREFRKDIYDKLSKN